MLTLISRCRLAGLFLLEYICGDQQLFGNLLQSRKEREKDAPPLGRD